MNTHPAANIFPMMSASEYEGLKKDLEKIGQIDPIMLWIDSDGEEWLVDGRNRYKACIEIGMPPQFGYIKLKDNGEVIDYVISVNLHRRHLKSKQAAAVAVCAIELREQLKEDASRRMSDKTSPKNWGAHDGESDAQLAKLFGTNRTYINEMDRMKEEDPDTFEKIRQGQKVESTKVKKSTYECAITVVSKLNDQEWSRLKEEIDNVRKIS